MTAIVVVFVPVRETEMRSANPKPAPRARDEREAQRETISQDGESDPPFWTWFIENPREGNRVAI